MKEEGLGFRPSAGTHLFMMVRHRDFELRVSAGSTVHSLPHEGQRALRPRGHSRPFGVKGERLAGFISLNTDTMGSIYEGGSENFPLALRQTTGALRGPKCNHKK